MGIENRDYSRTRFENFGGGGSRRSSSFADWEVWKKIIAINVAVFLLQIFITRPATENDFRSMQYFDDEFLEYAVDEELLAEAKKESASDPNASLSESEKEIAKERQREELIEEKRREIVKQQLRHMPQASVIEDWFALEADKVKQGQIWRLITTGFLHDRMGIFHILVNMLFLYWFGSRLENRYGSEEFMAIFFASLLSASFFYVALDLYTGKSVPAIGASGAVWGIVAVYALLYPYERIYIYFLFPVEIRFIVLIYFLIDLHPVLLTLSGQDRGDGIAHAAHIGGAIFGFLYWYNRWELMPFVRRLTSSLGPQVNSGRGQWANSQRRNSSDRPATVPFRTSSETPTSMDAKAQQKMDAILEKISREGRDSLTDDELRVLEESSREIRNQRNHPQ